MKEAQQRAAGKPISRVFWVECFIYICWLVAFALYAMLSPKIQNLIAADTIEAFQRFSKMLLSLQVLVLVSLATLKLLSC